MKEKIEERKFKKCTTKCPKELLEDLQSCLEKVKDPVTIGKAIQCTADIFPYIFLILNLISICPANGAVLHNEVFHLWIWSWMILEVIWMFVH